jgi:hypothetical protein
MKIPVSENKYGDVGFMFRKKRNENAITSSAGFTPLSRPPAVFGKGFILL